MPKFEVTLTGTNGLLVIENPTPQNGLKDPFKKLFNRLGLKPQMSLASKAEKIQLTDEKGLVICEFSENAQEDCVGSTLNGDASLAGIWSVMEVHFF